MSEEIVITYDTLYNILRKEKNSLEIQRLEPKFFEDVINYLKEKEVLLESKKNDHGLFGFEEKKKISTQIENVQRILREIYDWREKKIIMLASDVSKTNGMVTNKDTLLHEEKEMYDSILNTLNKYRNGILYNILRHKMPFSNDYLSYTGEERSFDLGREEEFTKLTKASFLGASTTLLSQPLNTPLNPQTTDTFLDIKIKFVSDVDEFMGPDMEIYGPFKIGDETNLPSDVAEMMINKKYGEKTE